MEFGYSEEVSYTGTKIHTIKGAPVGVLYRLLDFDGKDSCSKWNTKSIHWLYQKKLNSVIKSDLEVTWLEEDLATCIAKETDRVKPIRIFLFTMLLKAKQSTEKAPESDCIGIALEQLKGAFLTVMSKVVEEIIEPGYATLLGGDLSDELDKIIEYFSQAKKLTKYHWMYVKLEVSESTLKPLAPRFFPMLANVAFHFASKKSEDLGSIPLPKLSSDQRKLCQKYVCLINQINKRPDPNVPLPEEKDIVDTPFTAFKELPSISNTSRNNSCSANVKCNVQRQPIQNFSQVRDPSSSMNLSTRPFQVPSVPGPFCTTFPGTFPTWTFLHESHNGIPKTKKHMTPFQNRSVSQPRKSKKY